MEGLSLEGTYLFELTVVDRTKFVTKEVVVTVAQPHGRDRESLPDQFDPQLAHAVDPVVCGGMDPGGDRLDRPRAGRVVL